MDIFSIKLSNHIWIIKETKDFHYQQNNMQILPFRNIIINTHLEKTEAIDLFRKAVFVHNPPLLYIRGPEDFYAEIKSVQFTANRLLDYRENSFTAMIHGKFVQKISGAEIHIKMHPLIINLMGISLMIGFGLYFIVRDYLERITKGQLSIEAFCILLFPLFLYIFVLSMFNPEANRAESFLCELYQMKTENSIN